MAFSFDHSENFKWNLNNMIWQHVNKVREGLVEIVDQLKKPVGVFDHHVSSEFVLKSEPP